MYSPYKGNTSIKLTRIVTATFNVAAGGVGWVDTNVSATTGTDTNKLWVVVVSTTARQNAGVQPNGVDIDCQCEVCYSATFLSHVSATGHMDFYRAGADNTYRLIGYLA